MSQVFNADEVFAIGVQIEKNAREFYLAARDRTGEPALKKMFTELALWEGHHVELFEHLRTTLPLGAAQQIELDPDNMIHLYLKAIADNLLYADEDYAIDRCRNILEILEKALDFEKEAVVLYSSMKEIVPEGMGRNEIDELVHEELRHVGQITREVGKLTIKS